MSWSHEASRGACLESTESGLRGRWGLALCGIEHTEGGQVTVPSGRWGVGPGVNW